MSLNFLSLVKVGVIFQPPLYPLPSERIYVGKISGNGTLEIKARSKAALLMKTEPLDWSPRRPLSGVLPAS